jgi:salicylate hydroxylase
MALEDSVVLADLLAKAEGDIEGAFKRFEQKRFLRTARVQLQSRTLWEDFHCAGPLAQVRTARFTERTTEDCFRCLSWLWTPIDWSAHAAEAASLSEAPSAHHRDQET